MGLISLALLRLLSAASFYGAVENRKCKSAGEEMSRNKVVGFIGLGTIGGPMAANVQKAGYKLLVHDLNSDAVRRHLEHGAIWAESPRAIASQADVIFSSLPEPHDVEKVAVGPDG